MLGGEGDSRTCPSFEELVYTFVMNNCLESGVAPCTFQPDPDI